MNWRKYLTRLEARELARCDKELAFHAGHMAAIRRKRKLIQNRAYARGKK